MRLFGFEIKRPEEEVAATFVEPLNDDGAVNIGAAVGGSYGTAYNLEGSIRTEAELVTRYRNMMNSPEIQQAVDEIINELICVDAEEKVVKIVLDDVKVSDKLKNAITEEFENILNLLDFSNTGYEIMSKFYVDGRLNFHAAIDKDNPREGIKALHYIDPRKIRLVREIAQNDPRNPNFDKAVGVKLVNEYYTYSENNFGTLSGIGGSPYAGSSLAGIPIAKDSIIRVTSGIVNEDNTAVLSWMHNSYKPLNQLRSLEDATVIYTLTRAPERRIFYVDVGNLPKAKAEQYLYDMMARHKNRVSYDQSTGQLNDQRTMATMTEDYWFPRREGNRSTEIDVLPSAGQLMSNENIQYFQNKLYKSLNVPIGRLQPEAMAAFGRVSEMTREEAKFTKFIRRIRARFSILFDRAMERQLSLKEICSPEEWKEIKNNVRYEFAKDNFYAELLELEIMRERIGALGDFEAQAGTYFSRNWIKKHILRQTDEEIKEIAAEMEEEEEIQREKEQQLAMMQQQQNPEAAGQEEEQEEEQQA